MVGNERKEGLANINYEEGRNQKNQLPQLPEFRKY
jgi:hypothetical protein